MRIVERVEDLREAVRGWRRQGESIGFVPTMGNLHAGHHALVDAAKRRCARVVASVFVNPTQFGPNEDYARYPRTPDDDEAGLRAHACDLLFRPGVAEMYPFGTAACVRVHVPGLTDELDGAARPGHFDGVATVVLRLFNMVQPDLAAFGAKDFQQLQVIRYLVRELSLPVEILPLPTQRDHDGLALSSRNRFLDAQARAAAPAIHATLQRMREAWRAGRAVPAIEADAVAALRGSGFAPDYAAIRRAADLAPPRADERRGLVALIAARIGGTRLIDNLEFEPEPPADAVERM
ncbi:pantoate--beta-alanine ligase [Chiayiivirga flava]|uniref:Pantothenate synthetase n=1 Tax=Chiayiivirga flava TaxID=659595 RepID=A0A7W8FY40_9GAMM|nr:pantoate--beta-alanine ligase [Chiayiivirga flava]MBB5207007.1 pantoate--beta-alanine ligase [Chiayiivirga flava]